MIGHTDDPRAEYARAILDNPDIPDNWDAVHEFGPGEILGYRKNGEPIRAIKGGAFLKFSAALTPAIVATIVCAEQAFTVGPGGYDINNSYVGASKPTTQTAGLVGGRASSATQISLVFCNPTAAGVTPTAGEVYQFVYIA